MATAIFIICFILCGMWQAHAAVDCSVTGAGRHLDKADPTCKNYTLCIYVQSTDKYLAYKTACPSGTLFNPGTFKCVSPEIFTCNIKTTEAPTHSTICTSDGFIVDPDPTNCTTYIQCVEINGGYTQLRHKCPDSTFFNPNTTLCDVNYNCTEFTCKSSGRIANRYDFTCREYYYCVELFNGTFAQFKYRCPTGSVFNPISKLCTTKYVCS